MIFKNGSGLRDTDARLIRKLAPVLVVALTLSVTWCPQAVQASAGSAPLPKQTWSFKGVFGKFDVPAIKRGVQVAVDVCMACHSIKYIKFDQLRQFGFTEAEIKALAESQGRTKKDPMVSGMDPVSAKDAFGIAPPDLSLMTKARKGYEDYSFAILTGYASDADMALATRVMEDGHMSKSEALEVASALHLDLRHPEAMQETLKRMLNGETFNKYFPGNFFAMPSPLMDGSVTYADGTESTQHQMARDVVTFMAWAAEPTLMERKALGIKVILFLIVFTIMLYAVKRRVLAKLH